MSGKLSFTRQRLASDHALRKNEDGWWEMCGDHMTDVHMRASGAIEDEEGKGMLQVSAF